jgi:Kef-type K+ transport system membrane component KefB
MMQTLKQWINPETIKDFHFMYELALVLFCVKLAGHLSRKWGQPSVMGEILAGILLGPSVLGLLHPTDFIRELAEIGVILLMFLAGLETDLNEFRKTAYASSLVAVSGVIVPFAGGLAVGMLYGYDLSTSIFVGTLLVATSVSISVQTLRELGQLQTREGITILGAAVLDDVLGILILSVVIGFAAGESGGSVLSLSILLVKISLFFGFIVLVGKHLLPRLIAWGSRWRSTEAASALGIFAALAFAFLAELVGLAGIVGSYFAGLMLGKTAQGRALFDQLETVSFSFPVPVFFVSIGLIADVRGIDSRFLWLIVFLTTVAIITKLFGGALGAKLAGFSPRSSLGIGAGMIARGEVGLIVATIGMSRGMITSELFTATVIIVLATTLVTPPLLKRIFGDRQKNADPASV